MSKKLYINVFETDRGPGGHLIGPKQFTKLMGAKAHGLLDYHDVQIYLVADKSIKSKDAVECARFVCDAWDEQGRPTLAQVREKVQRRARKALMF